MPPPRCNPTPLAAAAVAQQRGRRRRFPGRLRRSSGGGSGVRRRRTRIAAVTAPTAIDAPAIRILASDPTDPLAEHGVWGRADQAPSTIAAAERRYPDGSNAGDVVKTRGGDLGHQPRGKHRHEAAAFKQGNDLLSSGATHDFALSCVRRAFRATRRQRAPSPRTSPAPRPLRHLIARTPSTCRPPRDSPCSTSANVRVTAAALNSAAVFTTAMNEQSRLIVGADSSITARC